MLVLAEQARRKGLFEWLAIYALRHARGSGKRLLILIHGVGVLVWLGSIHS